MPTCSTGAGRAWATALGRGRGRLARARFRRRRYLTPSDAGTAEHVTVLPGDTALNPAGHGKRAKVVVQPDATITSPSVYALVEAKRIRRSSFQPEQPAREFVAATVEAQASGRRPLLLLILRTPPPVTVSGWP